MTFEKMYENYFSDRIDSIDQIVSIELTGQELKDFVLYCIEQGSINTNVVRPTSDSSVGGELLATEAQDTVAEALDSSIIALDVYRLSKKIEKLISKK